MRQSHLAFGLTATLLLPSALLAQSTLKITSPANGVVVRAGQTIEVQVEVAGPFSTVAVTDPSETMTNARYVLRSPPYRFSVTVPARGAPGPYMITAELHDDRRAVPILSDTVRVDVERPDSPRELRVSADQKEVQVGLGALLTVMGVFPAGEEVYLNRSTRTTYESFPPENFSVNEQGQAIAKKPGRATIVARHQNLSASVDVLVLDANLRVTSPSQGTVVHPGETLTVEVAASGGPFTDGIAVFFGDAAGEVKSPPYRVSLKVPAPNHPGPVNVFAVGRAGSLPIFSDIVPVYIERLDAPEAIFVDRSVIGTEELSVGEQGRIYVVGKFRDNPVVNLTDSSLTTFETDKPGIVQIDERGYTKGLASGTTKVTIRYGELRTTVTVVVEE